MTTKPSTTSPTRALLVALLLWGALAISPGELLGHEFYLHPSTFHAAVGERVGLALEVGHPFEGSPIERRPGHLRRFVSIDASGEEHEVRGVDGAFPAGWLLDAPAGLVTVSYESHAMLHELPADRFESYLREEGLEAIVARRRRRGEAEAMGRELFSRCAKTVLEVGSVASGARPEMPTVGCPLELVPDAGLLEPGAEVSVRVLWRGAPLEGVLVGATRAGDDTPSAGARSDADGRVRFSLGPGAWLVHAVHMAETRGADSEQADWRSVWASLTFERRVE